MSTNFPVKRDMRKLLCEVQAEYDRQANATEYFRKQCQAFRKDQEIQELETQVAALRHRSLHVMSEAEYNLAENFRHYHYEKCKNGSTFQYELSGTGIGTIISIICPVCGERKDITDIESW